MFFTWLCPFWYPIPRINKWKRTPASYRNGRKTKFPTGNSGHFRTTQRSSAQWISHRQHTPIFPNRSESICRRISRSRPNVPEFCWSNECRFRPKQWNHHSRKFAQRSIMAYGRNWNPESKSFWRWTGFHEWDYFDDKFDKFSQLRLHVRRLSCRIWKCLLRRFWPAFSSGQ